MYVFSVSAIYLNAWSWERTGHFKHDHLRATRKFNLAKTLGSLDEDDDDDDDDEEEEEEEIGWGWVCCDDEPLYKPIYI